MTDAELYQIAYPIAYQLGESYAKPFAFHAIDAEDLAQEGMTYLFTVKDRYDPNRGDWKAFCFFYIRAAILNLYEHYGVQKRGSNLVNNTSLNTYVEDEEGYETYEHDQEDWMAQMQLESIEWKDALYDAVSQLRDDTDFAILMLHAEGTSLKEISEKLGLEVPALYQRIRKVRGYLREALTKNTGMVYGGRSKARVNTFILPTPKRQKGVDLEELR